jgi:hypothetical protein
MSSVRASIWTDGEPAAGRPLGNLNSIIETTASLCEEFPSSQRNRAPSIEQATSDALRAEVLNR